jgi:hypothetical protein
VRLAQSLLGRHVVGCAEHRAAGCRWAVSIDAPDQTEIADVRLAAIIKEDVGWFKVAMQDTSLMGVVDGASDLGRDLGRMFRRRSRRTGIELLIECAASDQLHGEERSPVMFTHLVDRYDVGMIEPAGGLCLALKTVPLRFAGELAGQNHLQRHDAAQRRLTGPVDHPHSAAGDFLQQLVAAAMSER